jgi:hypothetical protein
VSEIKARPSFCLSRIDDRGGALTRASPRGIRANTRIKRARKLRHAQSYRANEHYRIVNTHRKIPASVNTRAFSADVNEAGAERSRGVAARPAGRSRLSSATAVGPIAVGKSAVFRRWNAAIKSHRSLAPSTSLPRAL